MKLIEPFRDFEVKLNSYSFSRRYPVVRTIKPKRYPLEVSEERIKRLIETLNRKYPGKQYRYKIVKYNGRKYAVIRRGPLGYKNPPVYVDMETGRLFVPYSYYKREPNLVSYIISLRLRDFGGL